MIRLLNELMTESLRLHEVTNRRLFGLKKALASKSYETEHRAILQSAIERDEAIVTAVEADMLRLRRIAAGDTDKEAG